MDIHCKCGQPLCPCDLAASDARHEAQAAEEQGERFRSALNRIFELLDAVAPTRRVGDEEEIYQIARKALAGDGS